MFSSTHDSPKRKPSTRGFRALGSRGKPGLAVDTSFTRHKAPAPQQVFPYESKTQELSFIAVREAYASSKKDKKRGLKQQFENRLPHRPIAQRSISDNPPQHTAHDSEVSRPGFFRNLTSAEVPQGRPTITRPSPQGQPLHARIRGLRPSPLDLTHEVSPSDRAITIGIAIPSASVTNQMASPHSASQTLHPLRRAEEAQTPTIVITPAREDFALTQSPEELRQAGGYRPASSVYSRYTNCAPRKTAHGYTPPVPTLPLFINREAPRQSSATIFEEDSEAQLQPRLSRRLTSRSQLPTPRRSRGWWNVVTSPFSASSKSSAFFWRSPPLPEDEQGRTRILDDASEMGAADPHAGVIFTNRAIDDDELRTALPPDTGSNRPRMAKRSDTAPGALDANVPSVNIYRIPSQGLAAAYYDSNRHFSSMILSNSVQSGARNLEGWSPSQSVAHLDDDRHLSGGEDDSAADMSGHAVDMMPEIVDWDGESTGTGDRSHEQNGGPFADSQEANAGEAEHTGERNLFSTPSEAELKEATPPRPTLNDRSNIQATMLSAFSPLSATPIVEEAHTARFVGPSSEMGELREVELTPARSLTPPGSLPPSEGLSAATVAHQDVHHDEALPAELVTEKARYYRPALHSRNDSSSSIGLGISDAGSEKELFPPPKPLRRLGTDRFGQLAMTDGENPGPSRPWYKRFFWMLASFSASLLLLVIVLLVILVPAQKHADMAVQAEWLNLTGFPAIPIGVATVIQPNAVKDVSGCVNPQALWSCDVPVTQRGSASSKSPEQPNFRFEIRFRNGTVASNETQLAKRSSSGAAIAGALIRRESWASSLFTASPPAPSKKDQVFLGQYTDELSAPYDGEKTPFYISLLDSSVLVAKASKLFKRQSNPYPYPTTSGSNSSSISANVSTNAARNIPRPPLRANGEPATAELYPFAEAQPLRLFNRGQDDEHYGFYTYFDRSLYVSNVSSASNSSGAGDSAVAADLSLSNASAVCTWSQTRLHIQIWTRKQNVGSLGDPIPLSGLPAVNSTANDMASPGSFPYPVTVTLDRHGGQAKNKGVYCYGLDDQHHVMDSVKMWVEENRAFGGELVNAAAVPGSNGTTLTRRHGEENGGVDGGSGGCVCQWQNWN